MKHVAAIVALLALQACATAPAEPDLPERPSIQFIDVACRGGRVVAGMAIIGPGKNAAAVTIQVDHSVCAGDS